MFFKIIVHSNKDMAKKIFCFEKKLLSSQNSLSSGGNTGNEGKVKKVLLGLET